MFCDFQCRCSFTLNSLFYSNAEVTSKAKDPKDKDEINQLVDAVIRKYTKGDKRSGGSEFSSETKSHKSKPPKSGGSSSQNKNQSAMENKPPKPEKKQKAKPEPKPKTKQGGAGDSEDEDEDDEEGDEDDDDFIASEDDESDNESEEEEPESDSEDEKPVRKGGVGKDSTKKPKSKK